MAIAAKRSSLASLWACISIGLIAANRALALLAIWVTAFFAVRSKRAAEDQARIQADLENAQRVARLGSWVRELKTGEVRCSAELYRIFGLCPGEPVSFEIITERIHPGDRERFARQVKAALVERKPLRITYRLVLPDGATRVVAARAEFAYDTAGRAVRSVGSVQDITDAKKTDAALRVSQKRLAGIVDIAAEAIVSVDQDQRIILFNKGAEQTFGYAAAEVLGQPIDVLLPPDVRTAHRERVAAFAQGPEVNRLMADRTEVRARRKDGSEFPATASISKLDLEDGSVLTAILRDVSKYRQTEAALAWERDLLRTLMEAWPDLVFVKDRESRFLAANSKAAALMGAESPEEMIGKTDLDYHPPDLAADFVASERRLMQSGQAMVGREETIIDPDGETIWLSSTKVPLISGTRIVGLVGINRDVSAAKRTERALSVAKEQAEMANRAKSEFLANMSHELRTPLNAILGFSTIIAEEVLGPVGNGKYRDYCRDIRNAGQHLLDLINDILDLSKVESGADELDEEELDVDAIVRAVTRLLQGRAQAACVELVQDIPDRLPALHADERKLKQILANLLSNAVKFTAAGGCVTFRAWSRRDSGYVFQIADTGIGMAPEDIPRAMSLFGQIDGALDRKHEGTGLGLPLTKALVEMHGGVLDLQSAVGVGTTATVRFPAARIIAADQPVALAG